MKNRPVATSQMAILVFNGGQYRIFGDMLVTFSKLVGKKVIRANAYTLGEMLGADVDTGRWQITHLHVSLTDEATRELGFRKTF